MEPEIRYCTTEDGVDIAYYEIGSGEPLVVASAILWSNVKYGYLHLPEYERVGHGVGRGLRLVRYDPRGTGLSSQSSYDYTMPARLRDLAAVVQAARIESFHLFGSIHGSAASIEYAARNPERVMRLVLYMPYANGKEYSERAGRYESFRQRAYEDPREWEEYLLAIAAANFGYRSTEVIQDAARRFRDSMTPASLRAFQESIPDIDVRDSLGRVQAPTMVLYRAGAFTDMITLAMARSVAAGIPGSTFVHTTGERGVMWSNGETQAVERFLGIPAIEEPAAPGPHSAQAVAPHGTAIILFADIVDSTGLTERLGDSAFREKARDLEGALRAVIREHAGTAIEGKLLGDGVLAVFTSARQAIDAALACGRAGNEGGLPLHLGLHAGDVIREENNVFGGAVNIAARISGLSAPGEVLVSDVVRALARTSAGVRFEDRGEQALKGVGEPVRVWAVREGSA
jgi:class 3 adenylate cyclase